MPRSAPDAGKSRERSQAIVSLPDFAFFVSPALRTKLQSSFSGSGHGLRKIALNRELAVAAAETDSEAEAIARAVERARLSYRVFMAEVEKVG